MPGNYYLDTAWQGIDNTQPNVRNRFNDGPKFDYDQMSKLLESIYGGTETKLKRENKSESARARTDAAARAANQGITGGAILEDTMAGGNDAYNQQLMNALSELGIGKASDEMGLMKYDNAADFQWKNAATNTDMQNFLNALNKAQAQSGFAWNEYNKQITDANQPNGWDDFFATIDALSKAAEATASVIAAV